MKTASNEPSQTTTVAPIHVPIPLMDRPSVMRVGDEEGDERRDESTRLRARRTKTRFRRIMFARNGVISATATVKMMSAIDESGRVDVEAVEHERRDDQSDRVTDERNRRPHDEPNHAREPIAPSGACIE